MIAHGSVTTARGGTIEARLPGAALGDGVRVCSRSGTRLGTIGAFARGRAIIAMHGAIDGVAAGDDVALDPSAALVPLGTAFLGRAIDAYGNPLDDRGEVRGRARSLELVAPPAAHRQPISQPCWTGIRAIDGLITFGRGARIGVFGPPGTGKSTLLHAIVQGASADAVVVGLVGERGREAEEWIRMAPSNAAVVCATSDRSPAERVRAARVAMAQAAALRDCGLNVLLLLDSLARYAAAMRELTVASGEPVGRAGYPAGVFADLARYVEAAGATRRGSVTMVASVLSDGDERDPVSEAARALLDGHIQLSPRLAHAGRFPAIDLPASTSRTMTAVTTSGHAADATIVRRALSSLAHSEDARALGLAPGDDFGARAAAAEDTLESFLRQSTAAVKPDATLSALARVADRLR